MIPLYELPNASLHLRPPILREPPHSVIGARKLQGIVSSAAVGLTICLTLNTMFLLVGLGNILGNILIGLSLPGLIYCAISHRLFLRREALSKWRKRMEPKQEFETKYLP